MPQQAIDIDAAARVLLTLTRRMGREYTAAAESGTMAAGEIVEDMSLMPAWAPGKYSVGAVRQKDGQPYRCVIEHDSTINTDWVPGVAYTVWVIYHATTPAGALPFARPVGGASDAYKRGEYILWTDGMTYTPIRDGVSHTPDEYTADWEVVS